MKLVVNATSLRPGGGLTALMQIIGALANESEYDITLVTGANDSSAAVAEMVQGAKNIQQKNFFPNVPGVIRYLLSKLLFWRYCRHADLVLSFNYFTPTRRKQAVYHLNLLSFLNDGKASLGARVKMWDARIACRRATINLFESQFLMDQACTAVKGSIRNPRLLYLGVHPEFFGSGPELGKDPCCQVMLVSSTQPHKDNHLVVHAVRELVQMRPEVPWKLTIAGGQALSQWEAIVALGNSLEIAEHIEVLGPLERSVLAQQLSGALCLVSASRVESFCMVALEAMASGCPVVVVDSTSMPESVGDAALVVSPGSSSALAEAVLRLYEDNELREVLLRKGEERASLFSPTRFKNELKEVLK